MKRPLTNPPEDAGQDNLIREALNAEYALLTNATGEPASLRECKHSLSLRIADIGEYPGAPPGFPFVQMSPTKPRPK
jgi:hypothetical protein